MDELLALAARGGVTSCVEVVEFERVGEVMERLKNDEITGRVVVRLPQ
jgi:propanol-preferring alcohol dehydrogenase